MMKLLFYILCLLPTLTFAKKIEIDTFLVRKEDELAILLKNLRDAKTDNDLMLANIDFTQELKSILYYPGVLTYPFEKLNTMSTVKSPDGVFRLFNWNIEDQNQKHSHFCFLVKKKGSKNQVIEFKEDKYTLGPRPEGMLTPNRWYGALYYKIVDMKVGRKTFYTVFAFDGGTRSSNKKILDVFWFKGKTLRLGYPLFQDEKNKSELHRRIFIEYSDKASISVNYQAGINKIVFDHLIPETPNLKGMYEYYIPDMEYDAYFWENNFWNYQANINVGNEKEKSRRLYYIDKKTGEEKYKIVPINYIDPNPTKDGTISTAKPIENTSTNPKVIRKELRAVKKNARKANQNLSKEDKKLVRIAKRNARKAPRSAYKN